MAARRRRAWHPRTNAQWNAMNYQARREWIGDLDDAQVLRQAEVRAAAAGRTVAAILTAWVLNGYLGFERKLALVFTLEAAPVELRDVPRRPLNDAIRAVLRQAARPLRPIEVTALLRAAGVPVMSPTQVSGALWHMHQHDARLTRDDGRYTLTELDS